MTTHTGTSEDMLLAIDCGTQSLRSMIFSASGVLVATARQAYEPYVSTKPGWAEQDPEVFWQALCQTCHELKATCPEAFAQIRGVGVTAQRDTMINLDANGDPLRYAITWLDQRKARPVYHPSVPVRIALNLVGMSEAIARAQTDGKSNWIRQNQPVIWERTHRYVQVSGFLNHRLTGEFRDSVASQIGHIPFDYKRRRWAARHALNAKIFPVEHDKLCELVEPGVEIGRITSRASEQSGIPRGLPVVACGSDKGCETLGVGAIDESLASLSFGTTATIQTTMSRYVEPMRFMPSYPAPVPKRYNPEVEIFRGYWMISWFKNEFAHREVQQAAEKGLPPEVVMNEMLRRSPPGSMGLVVQPYWSPGLTTPAAKGAMIGFGDVHRREHVYRAVIEGLAYALLDGRHSIERRAGLRFDRAAVSGGASQSDEICQIAADIFNLPLMRGRTHESAGLGAAIVTAVGLGVHHTCEDAVAAMVAHDRMFEPDQHNVPIYAALYRRVYRRLYPAVAKLYDEIRNITGYPEKAEF